MGLVQWNIMDMMAGEKHSKHSPHGCREAETGGYAQLQAETAHCYTQLQAETTSGAAISILTLSRT